MPNDPQPPFPEQSQSISGSSAEMDPVPDHGEDSYKGSGRLAGKKALITGGDSGIGRADNPSPTLPAYATTKGAIQNFTAGLAQLLADRGIRANTVAPGPVWTPLIPSTMPAEKVKDFGKQVPMGRPAQPRELAPVCVMLASDEASYVSGATVAVTGGKPII